MNFRYCLNTSTLRGQGLTLVQEVEVAAQAGYQAIEPWVAEVEKFVKGGGKLADLGKRIAELGLSVESCVGFSEWITEAAEAPGGLEDWKRDLDLVAQIGAKRIAAPPTGAVHQAEKDLLKVAARYRRLLELGRQFGVVPQAELWGMTRWGPSQTFSRLGELACVLIESGGADACTLLDVFHIYTGGSPFAGLRHFHGASLPVFHLNDYPPTPPRETITSAHRVFPGDGIAPLETMIRDLRSIGFAGVFSLELFNPEYWQRDALEVARLGLEKMRSVVAKALECRDD
jgi:sugar phosphate isomerase/epimerase